jgi:hypothetical protein
MAYQVDDSFDTWPEVIRAGSAAAGLYIRCGSWIARNTQDGFVPAELAAMYGTREWVSKLVDAGLWETEESGYRDVYYFHAKNGAKLNPTHDEYLARMEAARERTRKWREGSKKTGRKGQKPKESGDASRTSYVTDTERVTHASRDASLSFPPPKGGKGSARPAAPGAARASFDSPPDPEGQEQKPDLQALRAQLRDASAKAHRVGNQRERPVPPNGVVPSLAELEAAIAELTTATPKEA